MESDIKNLIEEIKNIAIMENNEIYITGGYVRDKLMDPKTMPKDIDFVYSGDIYKLVERLSFSGYNFYPVKEEEGIYSAVIAGHRADIAKLKGSSIEEDLSKRDFTVNAIALNLIDKKVLDIFKGRRAINSRILQEVHEDSLKNDPIRILRGMRFYIKYGFHFSLGTEENVTEYSYLLQEAKGERILNELLAIIQCDADGRAFELMDNYRILENILPYILELKNTGKEDYRYLDVFSHMDLTYKCYKELLSGRIVLDNVDLGFLKKNTGGFSLSEYEGFACFVHDIGKYLSADNHSVIGSEIIENKCLELKFPREAASIVSSVVKNHQLPGKLFRIHDKKQQLSEIYKFFKECRNEAPYILLTSFCDFYAEKIIYDPDNEKNKFKAFIERLFSLYNEYVEILKDKWINGDCIIEKTKVRGHDIGILIDEVNELVFCGIIKDKEEALQHIITRYGG